MLNIITKREASDEEGFTLLELVIVVAILGILTAIAIPGFAEFSAFSKVQAAHANNAQLMKSAEIRIAEEGGRVTMDQGGQAFNSYVTRVNTITAEIVAEDDSDFNIGFIPMVSDGELYLCAFTIIGSGDDSPGVGRTDGPAECNSFGPNMGHQQFD